MWTLDEALELYRKVLVPLAEQHGFSAALYGSVLTKGTGQDLDVFMMPQRNDADIAGLLEALRPHLKAVGEPVAGDWDRIIVSCRDRDGRAIDLQLNSGAANSSP